MKVVTQLIRHFWERGELTDSDAQYLLRHGFCRDRDVPGFRADGRRSPMPTEQVELTAPEAPEPLEVIEETLIRRTTPRPAERRRRRRRETRAKSRTFNRGSSASA